MTTVKLSSGAVEGRDLGDGTFLFAGLPYAASPTGPRRFQRPVAVERWDGVRPAYEPGPAAPQVDCWAVVGEVYGSRLRQADDCLSLSIRTPAVSSTEALPVFVWLHGGGFALGSGGDPVYQGGALARQGVVEVSINYRLGAHGFSAVESEGGLRANLGLWDQIAALQWVQDEIAHLGGDPSRVTVAGHSAGAMAVACLMTSPHAKSLFQGAVMQSAGGPYVHDRDHGIAIGRELMARLGVDTAEALADVPRDQLLEVQRQLSEEAYGRQRPELFGRSTMAFIPVIDGDVVLDDPLAALRRGEAAGTPLLIGTVRDEAMLHLDHAVGGVEPAPEMATAILRGIVDALGPASADIEKAYRAELPDHDDLQLAAAVIGDIGLRLPTLAAAEAAAPHAPVFAYRFDQATMRAGRRLGAIHGAELAYLFGTADTDVAWRLSGPVDAELAERVQRTWASFIQTGRPDNLGGEPWPQYTPDAPTTVTISTAPPVTVCDPTPAIATLLRHL